MGKLRIAAANAFALEMVRTALQHSSIPRGYQLTGIWMHMDMDMGNDEYKIVSILIKIHGAPNRVHASCEITKESDKWSRGSCRIELLDDASNPTQEWKFDCEVVDNHVVATPASAPQTSV